MKKTDFQNFHFEGGLPYTSVLTMDPHMRLSGIISNSPKDLTFWLTSYIWTISNIEITYLRDLQFGGRGADILYP